MKYLKLFNESIYSKYITNIDNREYEYTLNDITNIITDDDFDVVIKNEIVKNRYKSNKHFRCITCKIIRRVPLPGFTLKLGKAPLIECLDRMKEYMVSEGFDYDYELIVRKAGDGRPYDETEFIDDIDPIKYRVIHGIVIRFYTKKISSTDIKTYEGFFDKLKKLIKPEEEVVVKVNTEDLEFTIKECLLDLEDNGFIINIASEKSNLYSREVPSSKAHRGGLETSFGKDRQVYLINISKPINVDLDDNFLDGDFEITGGDYCRETFILGDIKEPLLVMRDILESRFNIFINLKDLESSPDNANLIEYNIRFDIEI